MKESEANDILDDAFTETKRYENILSKTVEGSDVYKINNAGGTPVEVSDDTINVINLGIQMGDLSEGMFDITIGAVTDLWDFTGDNPHVPDKADLTAALEGVNYKNIVVKGNTVKLSNSNAQIDLGGVAKGYIADRITEYLQDKGVERAIINFGGNVVAIGDKDDSTNWTIGIERPYSDRTDIVGSVDVSDTTVVTSGIYERNFTEDGVLYHHVLNPHTGYPTDSELESVTITAAKGNSAFCDGLSTVCLMLGADKAQTLIEKLQAEYPDMGIQAAFIDKNDNMTQTDGMNVQPVDNTEGN
jgi:thiamine biosynthesis lipoprotein